MLCTRPLAIALFAGLCLWQPLQAAWAEEVSAEYSNALTLRERIMVDGDVVRLGDLFQESLSDGDVAVAQAPKVGQTLSLDARFLQQVARAYRLNWKPSSKYQKITIGRVSQRVTAPMVRDAVAVAVQERIGSSSDLDIVLDGGDLELDLPTDVENSVAVSAINFDPNSNRFAAILVAPADGPPIIQRNVFGTVYEMAQIPVPKRLISAGETIVAEDLEWQAVHLTRLSGNSLTDAEQLIGRMAKRPLKAGQILRQSDVAVSPVIRKNDLIRLVVKTGQMTLSVQGKAMQDAALGQSIRVINVNSNRQLSGTVIDAGTVAIGFNVAAIN
ncbi:flagellar basal body P-ring formation chaperone FlgA [Dongia deserti]|uniref:flagellar basal body P-ring formation chaperone FlgA n=1 Tax=Dongia deserti TaxID=2268030 RepID=UPI000E655AE3|nr:flagellar basal body P-ring formation chaperone FlgA [Dongia deserti]